MTSLMKPTGIKRAARALLQTRRGAAAAELAVILPVMMLLVAGIIEFGRLYQVYEATNRLATQYALSWANCSENTTNVNGVCSAELPDYTNSTAIGNIVPELNVGSLTLTMAEFTVKAGVATVLYSGGYASGSSSANPAQLADATTRAASAFTVYAGPAASQYVVVVEAKYQHSLAFFNTLMSPFLGNVLTPSYVVVQLKS
jgi:Flp pilus assembly protein TadG